MRGCSSNMSVCTKVLCKLEDCVLEKMATLGSRQVAMILHVLVKDRHKPFHHDFFPQLDARMEAVARDCNSQEVANTLWADATMGQRCSQAERLTHARSATTPCIAAGGCTTSCLRRTSRVSDAGQRHAQ